jgi:hypothetical protein
LKREQANKPRYVPPKDQFVLYQWEEYEDSNHWQRVREFMWNTFGYYIDLTNSYLEIKNYMAHSLEIKELGPIMEKYGLEFKNEEQAHKFLELLVNAKNNLMSSIISSVQPIWDSIMKF